MKVKLKQLEHANGLAKPFYATSHSAGVDLLAAIPEGEDLIIKSGESKLVKTGIAIALPDGYEAQIRPRSGLALKYGVSVLNTPGTIDADYRGEIGVIIVNFGKENFVIQRGDRIAQMVVNKYEKVEFEAVSELDSTQRGEGGFGSTGSKVA